MSDPVEAFRLMALSDVQLERAAAHRLIGYWQHLAEMTAPAMRATPWGIALGFANGWLCGVAITGQVPGWAVVLWLAVLVPAGAAYLALMAQHMRLQREMPDMGAVVPILAEMKRRAGKHTGQPGEAPGEA